VTQQPDPPAPVTDEVRITVLAVPRASANAIELADGGAIRIRVTAAPADGAANQAVLRVLAKALDVGTSRLRIVSGASARRKVVEVDGMSRALLDARLREIGSQPSVARRRSTAGRMPPAR
jgi:uncharacterized protein